MQPLTNFLFFKFILVLNALKREKYKIDHISKTKNRTKKIIYAKNERQLNSNLPCKLAPFGRPWHPNAI